MELWWLLGLDELPRLLPPLPLELEVMLPELEDAPTRPTPPLLKDPGRATACNPGANIVDGSRCLVRLPGSSS